jgi:hypothetical protein
MKAAITGQVRQNGIIRESGDLHTAAPTRRKHRVPDDGGQPVGLRTA